MAFKMSFISEIEVHALLKFYVQACLMTEGGVRQPSYKRCHLTNRIHELRRFMPRNLLVGGNVQYFLQNIFRHVPARPISTGLMSTSTLAVTCVQQTLKLVPLIKFFNAVCIAGTSTFCFYQRLCRRNKESSKSSISLITMALFNLIEL